MHIGVADPGAMNEAQRATYDEIRFGPRGCVPAVFMTMLDAPELLSLLQAVGRHINFESKLPADIRELAVLVVAATVNSGFEWADHIPTAQKVGVPEAVCDAARAGTPEKMPQPYREVAQFSRAIVVNGRLEAADVESLKALIGQRAVTELVVLAGYYFTLTLALRAAGIEYPMFRDG
jgi:4-carboxymuconolactone decarboxylase